jgi:S-DNA-T family DNA segregation ATPase FtsK/SpoIIIE
VLSRGLIAEEFGPQATVAWFLLDDYAEWLGQREQGIADILALSVGQDATGAATLRAVVTEAKYVGTDASAEARRVSKQQLRQTVHRIEDALFGDPGRLDRDLWLSRIADLLLDGTTAVDQSSALESVRDGIRRGSAPIDLRGYSHVFISGPADESPSAGEQEQIPDLRHGLQEVLSREQLRNLIKAYEANSSLTAVRQTLGSDRPWEQTEFRAPAPRVSWMARPEVQPAPVAGSSTPPAPEPPSTPPSIAPIPYTCGGATSASPPLRPVDSPGEAPPVTKQPGAPEAAGQDISSLIESRALLRSFASEADETWLENTAQKLRTALLGYGLQAKIVGTRLTPNAALVRFMGSDRLRVEDLEARQSALLTTHGLRLVAISPLPGEIVCRGCTPAAANRITLGRLGPA